MTTRELLARTRAGYGVDRKRCVSLAEMDRWLGELANAGILRRDGEDWQPTPTGSLWLRGCFPVDGDEVVAA